MAIKTVTLFGINKLLAVYVGPAGYVLLGQFQNAVQIVTAFASGAINVGVTKYTAEYSDEPSKQQRLWATAGTISLAGSTLTILGILLFRRELSSWLLHDEGYQSVFIWFAVGLVFFVLNSLLLAILNGKLEIRLYVAANVAGSLISFLITTAFVITQGIYGALVALSIFQSGAFFTTLLLCRKAAWFRARYLFGLIDIGIAKNLGKYTLMAITTAICAPVANMIIRDHLVMNFGSQSTGYWEAMSRLSGAYLMLFTTILGVYYLPKYAGLRSGAALRREILNGYKIILPVVTICCFAIYVLRDFIIITLFTREFLPMRDLFFWYQIGDVFKIGSWVLAFLMLGKTMLKSFMVTEVVFTASYILLTYLFTSRYGLIGTALSYAVNYLLYWFTLYLIMRNGILSDAHAEPLAEREEAA